MNYHRGQALVAEVVFSAAVFFVATGLVLYSHSLAAQADFNHADLSQAAAFSLSQRLLYSSSAGAIPSLAFNRSINLSSCAHIVSSLSSNETSTLDSLKVGPYRLGFWVLGTDGAAINATCAGCACEGNCTVQLGYPSGPPPLYQEISVVSRPVRLVDWDGSGRGVGVVRIVLYRFVS